MKFVTFRKLDETKPRLGLANDDLATYTDLAVLYPDDPCCSSLLALIESGEHGLDLARTAHHRLKADALISGSDVVLLPPLVPRRLRDTGMIRTHLPPILAVMSRWIEENSDDRRSYEQLVADLTGLFESTGPLRYADRDPQQITAPGEVLRWPIGSSYLDYELELAVVIGRSGRRVSQADAAAHIFGYTVYNDWSLRDIQAHNMSSGQGVHGDAKDFPGSNSLGPCVVTRDEIPDPRALAMSVRVNGEVWGCGSTSEAWCSPEDAVVALSAEGDIHAGEVWGSGTVRSGSAFELGRQLPRPSLVELEVEGIGILANYVLPSQPAPRPLGSQPGDAEE